MMNSIEEKQLFALPQSESNSFELAFHKFVKLKSSAVEKKNRATFSVGKEFIIIYYVSGIEWNLLPDQSKMYELKFYPDHHFLLRVEEVIPDRPLQHIDMGNI